jgi:GTP-binding protein Era
MYLSRCPFSLAGANWRLSFTGKVRIGFEGVRGTSRRNRQGMTDELIDNFTVPDDGADFDADNSEPEVVAPDLLPPSATTESAQPDLGADLDHSGYVAVVGRPNVGKSTLMNRLLGEKIAIVSPKPQTTRLTQLGIHTEGRTQVIFVDTPGIHQPRHRLGEFMVAVATDALREADVILFVIDLTDMPSEEDQRVAALAAKAGTPVVLALNKLDKIKPEDIQPRLEAYQTLVPNADWTMISAKMGDGLADLLKRIVSKLPPGPQYFPDDQLSDVALRQIAAEIIREKVMHNTEREVPHAIAVEVDEFKERSATLTYVAASIYVERDTQKPIIIGNGGAMLKKISTEARQEIETLTSTKVYLELYVKVHKDWRRDRAFLQRMGYRLRKD